MKRFETPILNVEKFDLVNIVTTSGAITPEEPKKDAVAAAAELFGNGEGQTAVAGTFTITL